ALRLNPGEGRVPRHVHLSEYVRRDLCLVVRVQHIIELEPAASKVLLESVPARHDFRIVGDRSHDERTRAVHDRHRHPLPQKSFMPHMALPMKSYNTSVVGPITPAACASRK